MLKNLDATIGDKQLAAIKKRTILHTLSNIHDIFDMPNTFNKHLVVNT